VTIQSGVLKENYPSMKFREKSSSRGLSAGMIKEVEDQLSGVACTAMTSRKMAVLALFTVL
jgi:hypothetical protein